MKKLLTLFVFTSTLSFSCVYSQTEVHSGILHTTEFGEETNLLKLHCDALSMESNHAIIRQEFAKYNEIKAVDIDMMNKKMYIKYTNELDANFILGILERVTIIAFYNNALGTPVYYTKTGFESFRR